MKKIIFIIFLFATYIVGNAQRYYSPNLAIGGKAGTTISKMSFSPGVEQSMIVGAMAGVSIRYTEEKYFGLIAEINWSQRGWKENFEEYPFNYSRTLTYIQVPLLTHIYFGGDKFKGFVNLGPEFGYMIGESVSANFDYKNISSVSGFPSKNRMNEQMYTEISNKFDYGISAGLGMEFIAKRRHSFLLEARYYFGIGNIFPSKKKDTFGASRGMSIMVSLGYMFRVI